MADWLSPEWAGSVADLWSFLPSAQGAEGSVCLSFVVAPRREVAVHWRYEHGKTVSGAGGALTGAELALALSGPDAADVISGRVEPSVAFMRGRLKASGDGGLLLAFLESTTSPEFSAWRERVAAVAPPPEP